MKKQDFDYMGAKQQDSIQQYKYSQFTPLNEKGTIGSGNYEVKGNFLYYDRKDTVKMTTKNYADIVMKLNRQIKLANENGSVDQSAVSNKKVYCQEAIDFLEKELHNNFYPYPPEDPYNYLGKAEVFAMGENDPSNENAPSNQVLDNLFR